MRQAHEIASQVQRTLQPGAARHSSDKNEPTNKQRQRFIAQIFVRLQSNYGHRWSSLFKNDIDDRMLNAAKAEWRFDLRNYSEYEIKAAFQVMKNHYANFPPTLPEFRKICSDIRRHRNTMQNSRVLLTRQKPRVSLERKKQHIENMRAVLAKSQAANSN